LIFKTQNVLYITAKGRGTHCRTNVNASGIPIGYLPRQKYFFGFQTGDIVKANIKKGKNTGECQGRVLCRATGTFDIKTKSGRKSGISYKHIKKTQNNDGYEYSIVASSPCPKAGASA
jgi:hypothetical protein